MSSSPAPELSLSEVLTDLVDPYLPRSRLAEDVEYAVLAAAHVWNATRPTAQGDECRAELDRAAAFVGSFIRKRERVKRVVEAMAGRLRRKHPDVRSRIVDVRLSRTDTGSVRVHVIWTADDSAPAAGVDARLRPVELLIEKVLGRERTVSPVVGRHALQALRFFVQLEPEAFNRRPPKVWAAAAAHTASRKLPAPASPCISSPRDST